MRQVKHIMKTALLIGLVFALLAFLLHGALHIGRDCGPHCPVCACIAAVRSVLLGAALPVCCFVLLLLCVRRLSVIAAARRFSLTPVSQKVRLSE